MVLALKVLMDIVSRVLIHFFSVIVEDDGKFSPWMTLISFYYLVGIMFIFHIFFNERRNYLSEKFWLGKFKIIKNIV